MFVNVKEIFSKNTVFLNLLKEKKLSHDKLPWTVDVLFNFEKLNLRCCQARQIAQRAGDWAV